MKSIVLAACAALGLAPWVTSCAAGGLDDEPDGEERTAEGASPWKQGPDIDSRDLHAKTHEERPRWRLYFHGQVCHGACENVILAVPEGAPRVQWLFISSADLRRQGAEAYFSGLVKRGRLSLLDLLALRDAVATLDRPDTLPSDAPILRLDRHPRQCFECVPGPVTPDAPSTAGLGGPVIPTAPHPPPEPGGVHYGPGWVDPSRPHGAPPPPAPARPDVDKGLSFMGRMRKGIQRATLKLLGDKHACYEACLAVPTVTGYGAYVCKDPWMRAIPETGVPCAIVVGAAAVSTLAAPWCAVWCDEVFDAAEVHH